MLYEIDALISETSDQTTINTLKRIAEYIRTQNNMLDSARAVLLGAEYNNVEDILKDTPYKAYTLGTLVASLTKQAVNGSNKNYNDFVYMLNYTLEDMANKISLLPLTATEIESINTIIQETKTKF